MIDLIKDNLDNVIGFVQEKYGELTGKELSDLKDEPGRLITIVEEKFGVTKEKLEADLMAKFGNIGDNLAGLKDKAKDLLGGFGK